MRRKIKLNFVSQPNPLRWLSFCLLTLGIIGAIYLIHLYLKKNAELEDWRNNYENLRKAQNKQGDSARIKTVEWEKLQAELTSANQVIARLSVPWETLFREVETSVNEQITLLSVEPDIEKQEIKIVAEAKNLDAMLAYMRSINTIEFFKDAYISGHQIQKQDPQKPVRFVVNTKVNFTEQPRI